MTTMTANEMYNLFNHQIEEYHQTDSVDAPLKNHFPANSLEAMLWEKSWIDSVQWHLEDLVRPEDVNPTYALEIKRRIDRCNQHRTNLVEEIDDYYMQLFSGVSTEKNARINTETPAWAIDRLSILALKIFHFQIEATRGDEEHRKKCSAKLNILKEQLEDLCKAIDNLLEEIRCGQCAMRLYRQMKMYNDPTLNPMLYKK